MHDFGDNVDLNTFCQILEMDESEEEREFSKPLVFGFFQQADETFVKMNDSLNVSQLEQLSNLGHYLKGSSATLGFNKVRDSCQTIQQYGQKLNLDGTPEPNEEACLNRIKEALTTVRVDIAELEKLMRTFFNES